VPEARILVIGAGALGCSALRTLAADGRYAIAVVDDDRVEASNLQRQVLYGDGDLGRLKVEAAAAAIAREFGVAVDAAALRFDESTGPALVAAAAIVLDATDDPATKFLVARLCDDAAVPYVYAGVARTGGQWMLVVPGESACLECAFPPSRVADESAAGCSVLGILAPVAGLVGAMQARIALTFLASPPAARPRAGRLHRYELTGARSRFVDFLPRDGCFCRSARERRGDERRDRLSAGSREKDVAHRRAS
jgi:molybdopterin/thiamine biosynthesis adenylyltransferase